MRSDPPVDAQLRDPPTAVTAFFSESLDSRLSSLNVLDGTGEQVDSAQVTFGPDPAQMSVTVAQELPPGFYTVVWETLSSVDGHLLKGSFPFTVLNPDGSQPSGPRFAVEAGYSGAGPRWDNVSAKWVGLSAALLLVGGIAFAVWVVRPASQELSGAWKRRVRDAGRRHLFLLAWPCLALLAIAGAAELVIQTRQLGGPEFLGDVLRTSWGTHWIQRQAVLGAIFVALLLSARLWPAAPAARRRRRELLSEAALWVALAGGLGYLLLVAMVSHGASLPGSFWAVAADFAHLTAAAVWIGMLAQLALLFLWSRREAPKSERAVLLAVHLQRFSALAATSVVLLLATGTVNGLSQIPVPEAMLDTSYGRALTVKLALMLVLLAVAAANALVLRPRLLRQPTDGDAERLRRLLSTMVRLEAGLALAVLLAAAVLVQYPTARQERAAEANVQASTQAAIGFEDTQPAGDLQVNVSIAPNLVGTNSFQVFLFPPPGGQVGDVQRIRLRFKPPDPTLGPSEIIAEPAGANFYKAVGAFFTLPGSWELQVDVRRRQVEDTSALFRVAVAGAAPSQTGGRFALPLVVGSWTTVGAAGVLLAALLMAVWAAQWPNLPLPALRTLRVGRVTTGVFGLVLLGAALWLLPLTEEPASGNPIKPSGASIAIGRSLYTQNCAQCHGPSGRGDGPLAPTLSVPPADFRAHVPYHSDRFFFQVISNGLGNFMPPFTGQLTEEQRWHLINFLKAEFGVDAQPNGR